MKTIAEQLAGEWVADKDMGPLTNIAGRRFWARGNIEGYYNGYWPTKDGLKPDDLWWHFPTQNGTGPERESCKGRCNTKKSSSIFRLLGF